MSADVWRPRLKAGVQLQTLTQLTLSPQEGFAVSRIDGSTSEHELALLTGLSEAAVGELLARLEVEGVIEPKPSGEARVADDETRGANLLALYREQFYGLPEGERVQAAQTISGNALSALCYDPLPAVIRAVLENPHTGPEQARLIAAHHATSTGLDLLLNRADLARDAEVQRRIWRNPQLTEGQVRKLTAAKRLLELWKLNAGREATAQARSAIMKVLRAKFPQVGAEERVELIMTTEGRCLTGLAGIPIDGRTTSLLCARTYSSVLLVSNIATWSVAPPPLIAHLLKQPMVQRQPTLRKKLELHPNAPSGPR
ncbi:MAG: hypothetical protein JNK82_18705 [Myxococcaceae bacterium]|nr:hypothetical protein [Myxococcaceae bacterium]